MTEERIAEGQRETKKNFPLSEDLKLVFPYTFIGSVTGLISSFVYPHVVPEAVRQIRKGEIKYFSTFMLCFGGSLGYLGGLSFIGYLLAEHGNKPQAWIPIATNLISGVARHAYKRGKEKGTKQIIESQNGLESKVAEA